MVSRDISYFKRNNIIFIFEQEGTFSYKSKSSKVLLLYIIFNFRNKDFFIIDNKFMPYIY